MLSLKNYQKAVLLCAGLAALVLLGVFNPYEVSFFPQCPFHKLTGFLCPGCGAQRCLHFLLNAEFSAAFRENALIPLALPYLGFHTYLHTKSQWKTRDFRLREFFYGQKAIVVLLISLSIFTLLRNII